jgi:hypothetical protein
VRPSLVRPISDKVSFPLVQTGIVWRPGENPQCAQHCQEQSPQSAEHPGLDRAATARTKTRSATDKNLADIPSSWGAPQSAEWLSSIAQRRFDPGSRLPSPGCKRRRLASHCRASGGSAELPRRQRLDRYWPFGIFGKCAVDVTLGQSRSDALASHRRGSVWRAHLEPRERATKSHARLVRRTPLPGNNGLLVTKALPSAPRAPSLKIITEGSLLQSEMRSGPRGPVPRQRGGS